MTDGEAPDTLQIDGVPGECGNTAALDPESVFDLSESRFVTENTAASALFVFAGERKAVERCAVCIRDVEDAFLIFKALNEDRRADRVVVEAPLRLGAQRTARMQDQFTDGLTAG